MNAAGQRKMPREKMSGSEDSDTDEDPSFSKQKKKKPVKIKIKKELGSDYEDDILDEDFDPTQTISARKGPRQRKRPSFFQEYENEENNLDKILDDFELQQIEESKHPREKPVPKPPGSTQRRYRRRKRTPSPEIEHEPVELETSRSGRVRKKPKFQNYFDEEDGEMETKDEDEDDDFAPEDEAEKNDDEPEEEFMGDSEASGDENEGNPMPPMEGNLPIKKRRGKHPKKLMTDEEIEEATKRAMSAKPVVSINRLDNDSDDARNVLQ
jgi:hypothetical protein